MILILFFFGFGGGGKKEEKSHKVAPEGRSIEVDCTRLAAGFLQQKQTAAVLERPGTFSDPQKLEESTWLFFFLRREISRLDQTVVSSVETLFLEDPERTAPKWWPVEIHFVTFYSVGG